MALTQRLGPAAGTAGGELGWTFWGGGRGGGGGRGEQTTVGFGGTSGERWSFSLVLLFVLVLLLSSLPSCS